MSELWGASWVVEEVLRRIMEFASISEMALSEKITSYYQGSMW